MHLDVIKHAAVSAQEQIHCPCITKGLSEYNVYVLTDHPTLYNIWNTEAYRQKKKKKIQAKPGNHGKCSWVAVFWEIHEVFNSWKKIVNPDI